jgi:hypothetical protein
VKQTVLRTLSGHSAEAAEYRRYAQSCRDLAERAPNDEDRHGLLRLAEAWEQLARETEQSPGSDQLRHSTSASPAAAIPSSSAVF